MCFPVKFSTFLRTFILKNVCKTTTASVITIGLSTVGVYCVFCVSMLTHCSPICLSIPSESIRKPLGFLMFSGGIGK